jgi:hypothetical protein
MLSRWKTVITFFLKQNFILYTNEVDTYVIILSQIKKLKIRNIKQVT